MTIKGFPRTATDPAVCGGRPIIAGTRMRVSDIWEMLAGGGTMGEIVEDFPYLCEDDVREAVALASMMLGHPEQLDYERLLRRDRQAMYVHELDEETIEALKNVEIREESFPLNQTMDASEAR